MITYYKRTLKDDEIRKLDSFERGSWIHVVNPNAEEIDYLVKTFNLDKQNLLSGIDHNEVPRVEEVDKDLYIILKIIALNPKYDLDTILIIVGKEFILTLSHMEPEFIKDIISKRVHFYTTQKLKSLLKIISMINKDFERTTLATVKLVNSKKEALTELTDKDINVLLSQESKLNNFVSAYSYANLVYRRIINQVRFYEQDKDMIEDLIIESKQGLELCESSLKTLSNIRNHFMILSSNKLNRVITLLTIFTIMVAVPSAISGIFGMNVTLPLEDDPNAFYFVLILIALVGLIFVFYLKKKRVI